ncbi:MAG: hypothetical protein K2L12_01545, partial [Clostridia bacterium]|nr:hypothetical protein [Clostridia bacterium]
MKNKILKICSLIAVALLSALVGLLAFVDVYGVKVASAETSAEVLQDLRKDKDFNENDYPYIADDYSLQVIQIAESANKELFVYAYQPCNDTYDLVGTKISISYGYSVNGAGLTPKLYNLKLVSTSGTLDKYYVQDFTVPNDGDRYYNIVEIFRIFNSEIDESDETFPKTDIAYSVGQQWYVCDLNKSKHYEMNTFDTLYVETVFNGNLEFTNGIKWGNFVGAYDYCDCWFYCFNVDDYVIKHIFDADLNYSIRDASQSVGLGLSGEITYKNERLNQVITLKDTDVMKHNGGGLLARNYEWNRILSSADFVKYAEEQKVTFTDSQKEKILSSQWVFTFLETEIRLQAGYGSTTTFFSDVYDVGLLRLHFQDISGNYYDLGVVNDLTDPDNVADGFGSIKSLTEAFGEFWEKFVRIILLILFLILLVVVLNFVAPLK